MTSQSRAVRILSYVSTAAISLALIAWSVTLTLHPQSGTWAAIGQELLSAIGTAGFVAAVVAASFGWIEQRRDEQERKFIKSEYDIQVARVKRDVFEAVLQKTFGDEMMREIRRQVLSQTVIRRDCRLAVSFSPVETDKSLVMVHTELNYYLRNLSLRTEKFELRHNIDDPVGDQSARFVEIKVSKDDAVVDCLDEGAFLGTATYDQAARDFCKEYEIGPGQELLVEMKAEKHQRRSDQYVWHAYLLAQGFECTTILPDSLGLDLFYEVLYPGGNLMKPRLVGGQEVREWSIKDGVLLPFQGIQLRWQPRKNS